MTASDHRYTRRHRIATGGMGEVWLVHDEVLHRDVAVKYLKQEYADDEGFRTRFLHEARNAAALLHPGIATVFDFGEGDADSPPFLVMELVDGRPLSDLLVAGAPLDPERAREIVAQAADALAVAHAAGVVHRDVKPGNLLVTAAGDVKITDFGIARAGEGMALTETGQLIGTPSYISPEQAEGRAATRASDVYALGVVLYECLTGTRPFVADAPVAIALAHIREPVPELPAEVPPGLAAVTRRALAKDPDERYVDAAELAAELHALSAEQTMLLTGPVATAAVARPLLGRLGAGLARDRLPVVLTGVLGALVVMVVVVLALTSGDGGKTPAPSTSPSAKASTPATVRVAAATYVGRPVAEVRSALTRLGLTSKVTTVPNPGGRTAGTVSALRPVGTVRVGATITLEVWGAVPQPDAGGGDGSDPGKGDTKGSDKGPDKGSDNGKGKGNK